MRLTFILSIFILVFVSCNRLEPNVPIAKPQTFDKKEYTESMKRFNEGIPEKPKPTETVVTADSIQDSLDTPMATTPVRTESGREKTDTVTLKVSYGKAKHEGGKLAGDKVLFIFDSDTAKKLFLKVTPAVDSANLRISQYTDPDGNSSGPFTQTAEIPIEKPGLQKILVSESLMVGEPYEGQYVFDVRLGW